MFPTRHPPTIDFHGLLLVLHTPALEWPRWAQMWAVALAIYIGCKWLTWQRAARRNAPVWKHLAYLIAWPGMDAESFLAAPVSNTNRCPDREWRAACGRLILGLALLYGSARMVPTGHDYAVGWLGMIGILLTLHFGGFHLLSCAWRSMGVQARAVMNRPLVSTSLSEFWGRRWNTAFRDLTHQFLFRRFASRFGPRWGILAGFLFSGAVHDVVISIPARGGYGRPTAFFAIQGAAMVIERSRFGRRVGLGSGWSGRLFAAAVLITPAGLLFHPPFVLGVVVPFMRAVGAI
jgi:hypothetical protein